MTNTKKHRGFGAIAAMVVVVFLGVLAAAMMKIGVSQHTNSAQDVLSARAWQAARAGTEWGLYQALRNNACTAGTTLDLSSANGFRVTVSCSAKTYNEGEIPGATGGVQTVTVFTIRAVACNVSGGCPASGAQVAAQDYIERAREVVATN
jgi:MSHA biogenesis protein MshP